MKTYAKILYYIRDYRFDYIRDTWKYSLTKFALIKKKKKPKIVHHTNRFNFSFRRLHFCFVHYLSIYVEYHFDVNHKYKTFRTHSISLPNEYNRMCPILYADSKR